MQPDIPDVALSGSTTEITVGGNHFYVPAVSPAMRAVERTIHDISGADIPVLILGESGTGKSAVALRIHQLSRRNQKPFIKVSCASLTLEFFKVPCPGDGQGAWPWPAGGTLFLDEVGELDSACQPKLLCALPDGEVVPGEAGSGTRVITASSHNLEREMREGRFREDLYYRISGMCIRLLALRQRKEDIPGLVNYFLRKYSALFGRDKPEISQTAMRAFIDYSWPGNIRELEHCVQKIIALGDERVALTDLRASRKEPVLEGNGVSLKQAARAASRQAEHELILRVLARTRWNRKRAAQELGISYKALLYKMKQVGIDSAGS